MTGKNLTETYKDGKVNEKHGKGEGEAEKSVEEGEGKKNRKNEEDREGKNQTVEGERKLTWGREEFYRKLQKQNIYFLRVYGREVGVSRPTSKRKGQLIDEIVKILTGEKPPSKRSGRGAPPKSADLEEVLSGIAVRKNAVAVLKLTKREFTLLAELVCMGNIIAQANEEEEKMRRCRELTYKICRQCSLFVNATQRKAQGGKRIRSDP